MVKRIAVRASADAAWDAVRAIGALHTRLVPGFVINTKLESDARLVMFVNSLTIREPIIACDEVERRLVWTAEGGRTRHYNASVQVSDDGEGATIAWIADFLAGRRKGRPRRRHDSRHDSRRRGVAGGARRALNDRIKGPAAFDFVIATKRRQAWSATIPPI